MVLRALVRLLFRILFSLILLDILMVLTFVPLSHFKKEKTEHPHIKGDFVSDLAVSSPQVHLCLPYSMLAPLGKKSWPNIYSSSSLEPGG